MRKTAGRVTITKKKGYITWLWIHVHSAILSATSGVQFALYNHHTYLHSSTKLVCSILHSFVLAKPSTAITLNFSNVYVQLYSPNPEAQDFRELIQKLPHIGQEQMEGDNQCFRLSRIMYEPGIVEIPHIGTILDNHYN